MCEHDRETLTLALAAAADGTGAVLRVEGGAGTGKTALLTYAARCAADRGMRVLDARACELECDLAYGVVRRLFAAAVAGAPAEQRGRWLAGAAGLAIPVVWAKTRGTGSFSDRGPFLRGLYWLAANLAAEQPLLLVVDDAQWADDPSLAFLSCLARNVEELPILIVSAARTGAGRAPARVADPNAVAIVLRPATLNDDAAAQRDALDPLRCLDAAANDLAFAVAALGDRAALPHAAALAGLAEHDAASAADALTAAAIFDGGRPLSFVDPIVCAATYDQPAPARRAAAHKRAARLLAQDGADDLALTPHLLATEPAGDAWVVEHLCRAAQDAAALGAGDAAYTYLERARREPPPPQMRPHVLLALGIVGVQLAKPAAADHLREALCFAPDLATRCAAAQELTWALAAGGRLQEALELGHQVLASLPPDSEAALRFEGRLAALARFSPAIARSVLEHLERHEHRLAGDTAGERMVLASLAFRAANRGETATTTADHARRALADGRLLRDDGLGGPNFLMAVSALLHTDQLDEADHQLDRALDAARADGSETAFATATGLRCQALLRRGRLAQVEAEALAALAAVGADAPARPMLLAAVLSTMLERSDPATWEAFLAEHGIDGDLAGVPSAQPLLLARARLRLAAGDASAALRDLEELHAREEGAGLDSPWIASHACRALAHRQRGDRVEAGARADEELTRAGRWGTPSALGGALRTMAAVRGGAEAISLLRASVTALEHSPAHYELACSLADLGAALRRAGQPREACAALRRAVELADDGGAVRLARLVRAELAAAGARPRRAARRGCHPLTPTERRIAQLAAKGHANRDIAQALFVTVRTVETHLGQVYAKLGVPSPERLSAALHA